MISSRIPVKRAVLALASLALVAGLVPGAAAAPGAVPPAAFGPDLGASGVKLKRPMLAAAIPLAEHGYVETEHLVTGTARLIDGSQPKDYSVRVIVRRPADVRRFNGTVVQEWFNVSTAKDVDVVWVDTFPELLREGYAWVGVSAQPSRTPLTAYDPVRYAGVRHPGDAYAEDLMQQVAVALKSSARTPLGARARAVLATGQSQSAERLHSYLKAGHEQYRVFDGFFIDRGVDDQGSIPFAADPSVPTVFALSEFEAEADQAERGRNVRVWQLAGGAHVSHWLTSYSSHTHNRDLTGAEPAPWDRQAAGEWGVTTRGAGVCGNRAPAANMFGDRYGRSAALHELNRWVRTGRPAQQPPLMEFDGDSVKRDADGNALGGVRLPQLDVPVAAYNGEMCPLLGSTRSFSDAELLRRYPSFADYQRQLTTAAQRAVKAGVLRSCDAADITARAVAASSRWPADVREPAGAPASFGCGRKR